MSQKQKTILVPPPRSTMTDATKLAESLRAMRRNARPHWQPGPDKTLRHSIMMDSTRLGDLTDAADLIEQMAAEIKVLKEAPAVLLADEQVRDCIDSSTYAVCQVMAAEAMSLRANGKAVA